MGWYGMGWDGTVWDGTGRDGTGHTPHQTRAPANNGNIDFVLAKTTRPTICNWGAATLLQPNKNCFPKDCKVRLLLKYCQGSPDDAPHIFKLTTCLVKPCKVHVNLFIITSNLSRDTDQRWRLVVNVANFTQAVEVMTDFPVVFFRISHWYLSKNTIDKSK